MHDFIVGSVMLGLIAFIVWIDHQHRKERQTLLNRIMARDYHEYSLSERQEPPTTRENFVKQSIENAYRKRMNETFEAE